jgi:hypothetical protein
MYRQLSTALTALVLAVSFGGASAQEVTLRGISSFAEKTFYSRGFERFIEKVNADGKGVIQINYIDAAVRSWQCAEGRRGRHRERDWRLLHKSHA